MTLPMVRFRLLSTAIVWIVFFAVKSQSWVNFTADIQDGCSPIFVKFTNQSNPLSGAAFFWDFGNGNTSTAVHPQATFIEPGSYTVKLVMTNAGVKDSLVAENFIVVRQKPKALFSFSGDTLGCAPFAASFTNLSTDQQGSPLTYLWSFGDGSKSTEINPSVSYATGGDFDVTLLATNQYGCSDAYTSEKLLHVLKPIVKFGADQTYSCNGKLNVAFNNLTESPVSYTSSWEFGDGKVSSEKSPLNLYEQTGNYTVKLTVADTFGCMGHAERANLIQIVKTEALFVLSDDTICPQGTVKLTNLSKSANRFTWLFGDGTTSNIESPEKRYNLAGNYPISLVASNGTCTDTLSSILNVENVKADFSASGTFICQLPQSIGYQNLSVNAHTYDWRFGNGTQSTQENPQVSYLSTIKLDDNKKAVFNDTLIVTSKHGCKDKMVKAGSVTVQLPKVLMDPGAGGNSGLLAGCIPMSLVFKDKSVYVTPNDSIVSRTWKLGTGNEQAVAQLAVDVTSAGKIPVTLKVTTARGCVHTVTENINAGEKVSPDFVVVGNTSVCGINAVDFTIISPETSKITSASWDFGDGDKDAMPFPPHFYVKTGPMNVTLNVYNYGCKSTVTKNNAVTILGPIASVNRTVDCEKPFEHHFVGTVQDATSYQWDFGDGSALESSTLTPAHQYSARGNYVVKLKTVNSQTGCAYDYNYQTSVRDIKSIVSPVADKTCVNTSLTFDASNSIDADAFVYKNEAKKYLWVFNSGADEVFTDVPIARSFGSSGVKSVSLVTKDVNGCADTATIGIKVFSPKADFQGNYKLGCMPVTFAFNDLSQSDTTIVSWLWNFGDNSMSTLQNPEHDYTQFGKYSVGLRVTDAVGCTNQLTKNQHVMAVFPSASFSAIDSTLCIGDSTRFTDTSESLIVDYKWTFGNGGTSTKNMPTWSFPDAGEFTVTLDIVDNHGCQASSTRTGYIKVQDPPVADFVADVNSSSCYPFVVQFTDLSQSPNLGGWKWSFGENSNISALKNPFFIYNKPGDHDVTLVSYTTYGCSDTIVKKGYIHVEGPYAEIGVADTICKNIDTEFVAFDKRNIYDMKWDFGDGYTAEGDSVWHRYTNAGNVYPVLFIRTDDQNTCNKAIVDTLHVLDLRARFYFQDNISKGCKPFLPVIVNNSLNGETWKWDFGDGTSSDLQNPSILYHQAGNYPVSLTAYHHLGCSDTLTDQIVTVWPLPSIATNKDTVVCLGGTARLSAQGGITYSWSPVTALSAPNSAATLASPLVSTKYKVEVTDGNFCVDSAFTNVFVQQIPVVAIKDSTIIVGEDFTMDITDWGILSYSWTPTEGLSCSNCSDPEVSPLVSTNYVVTVTDTSNCFTVQYPLNVTVLQKFSVDVPDAFTPNDDGVNDRAFVNGWGIKELVSMKIFNRFGQIVYQSSDLKEGWDGNFNGKPQPMETYQYVVVVKGYNDGILTKKGSLILIR
ncbi:MAG: PKD domain-containing protein [Breznakibacter sp.]